MLLYFTFPFTDFIIIYANINKKMDIQLRDYQKNGANE